MKSSVVIFAILTVYFWILGTVYTLWNQLLNGTIEWAGSLAIYLSGGLTAMICGYVWLAQRKQGGVLAEDRLTADIDDGDPEIGEFSPWSWWPLVLAFSVAVVVLGLCIGGGFWLSFFALPLVIVAMVGWVYEHYRGNFAR